MVEAAMADAPDVLVLPETWDISYLPRDASRDICDEDCRRVKEKIGALAKQYGVNIVAGSVSNARGGELYNTACVFDRQGNTVATYDKTHLFSHSRENLVYEAGDHLSVFTLDGVRCGVIICYDLRFPELTRSMCLEGMDVLFVVCQWPQARIELLQTLCAARAIENQIFVVCCDACGTAGGKVCGGGSAIFDPSGRFLAQADDTEQSIRAEIDPQSLQALRESFPVFRDRRTDLYHQ
jgi:predicted amidohydrolase